MRILITLVIQHKLIEYSEIRKRYRTLKFNTTTTLTNSDKLINYLMNSLDKTWTLSGTYFMKEPYLFWEDALENSNKDEIIPKIKDYLVNKWYDAHKDMSWYNSHKKGDYFGYWSFESAAIVNALGLNDTCLKGVKYYPYDLVHYEN